MSIDRILCVLSVYCVSVWVAIHLNARTARCCHTFFSPSTTLTALRNLISPGIYRISPVRDLDDRGHSSSSNGRTLGTGLVQGQGMGVGVFQKRGSWTGQGQGVGQGVGGGLGNGARQRRGSKSSTSSDRSDR